QQPIRRRLPGIGYRSGVPSCSLEQGVSVLVDLRQTIEMVESDVLVFVQQSYSQVVRVVEMEPTDRLSVVIVHQDPAIGLRVPHRDSSRVVFSTQDCANDQMPLNLVDSGHNIAVSRRRWLSGRLLLVTR